MIPQREEQQVMVCRHDLNSQAASSEACPQAIPDGGG